MAGINDGRGGDGGVGSIGCIHDCPIAGTGQIMTGGGEAHGAGKLQTGGWPLAR
jgi:hypothetical protein